MRRAYQERQEREAWQAYVAESLRCIGENTAHLGGRYIGAHWADILRPPKEDERTPEQVAGHIMQRLREA